MEVFLSTRSDLESVPDCYVLPPDKRPKQHDAPVGQAIPVIDIQNIVDPDDRAEIVQQIVKACQEFGLFQVVNHGVPGKLMDDAMSVLIDFFTKTPAEYKAQFITDARDKSCVLYTSNLIYDDHEEGIRYWRDCFIHHCYPLEDHIKNWPEDPPKYQEVIGPYSVGVRKFLMTILDLLCEGLGLEPGYFAGGHSKTQLLSVNHHIPCPDPSLTLGHAEHSDPNLIAALHQCDVPGLQTCKDGQWIGVQPIPHAFVIIPGVQFKPISNGMFSSPRHRVVANTKKHRTTLGSFLVPTDDSLTEPSKALINESNPQRYKPFTMGEFMAGWRGRLEEDVGLQRFVIE
ncbi:unnamed protein product [Camellia sinensis]